MKTYACDQCGAIFTLGADDLDDVCPECFSDKTVLISSDKDFEGDDLDEALDDDPDFSLDDADFDDDLDTIDPPVL